MERRYLHRILIVALASSLFFGLILARLYYLQWLCHEDYTAKAAQLHSKTVKITPHRGTIYDRRGQPLASTEVRETAYLVVSHLRDQPVDLRMGLANELADRLGVSRDDILDKIHARRREVVLARQLPREKVQELSSLGTELALPPGTLYFAKEGKRVYPQGALAAHVVGYTQPDDYGDNLGVAGVEGSYDEQVRGAYGSERVEVSATRLELSPVEDDAFLRSTGNDLYLTIDMAIQNYAEQALAEQVSQYEAKGGICVVMEVGTGAVLAMASLPSYDVNRRGEYPMGNLTNRCVVHAIAPGSVMKTFTTVALLEHNRLSPYEWIDCHQGTIYYPSRSAPIRDSHPLGVVQVHEAFAESSNVAYSQLGQRLTKKEFHGSLERFGFGRTTGIDLPGEASGILHPVNDWSGASIISLSIGYEITATPLQVASAMAAVANRGVYVRPRVLQEVRSPAGEVVYRAEPCAMGTVCSPQTSEIVLRMMEEVVEKGTGKTAALAGYRLGGKTGTTRKHGRPGDEEGPGYFASFLGVLPIDAPRLVIYAWVEDPNVKWGGTVAAPIVQKVASHAVRILNIKPTGGEEAKPLWEESRVVAGPSDMALPTGPAELMVGEGDAPGGRMPNLTGMTVREAVASLNELRLDAQLVGWGLAVRQQPAPGEAIRPDTRGLVVFQSAE